MRIDMLQISELIKRYEELESDLEQARDERLAELQGDPDDAETWDTPLRHEHKTHEKTFEEVVLAVVNDLKHPLQAQAQELAALWEAGGESDFIARLLTGVSDTEHQLPENSPLLTDLDDAEEFLKLHELLDSLEGYGGDHQWRGSFYPDTLIAEHSFEQYAQEEAESMGVIPADQPWPTCYIDWKAAAEALQMDYTSVEYDGTTYWYRSN